MKTPEEYLEEYNYKCYQGVCNKELFSIREVRELLTLIQKETWNEALDKAAESADVTDLGIEGNAVVDLNSILKLKL